MDTVEKLFFWLAETLFCLSFNLCQRILALLVAKGYENNIRYLCRLQYLLYG